MSTQNNCSLLQVEIVDATNLRNAELLSTSDPYCDIKFQNEEDAQPRKQYTTTISNCLNPTWNEKFHFLITDDVKYFDVKVKDKNMLRDESLGFCRVLRPSPDARQKRTGGVFVLEKGKNGDDLQTDRRTDSVFQARAEGCKSTAKRSRCVR